MFIQIPIGARFIGIPGTESAENPRGVMVEVYWEQDDSGSLCISGNSPETPVPQHVNAEPMAPSRASTNRVFLGREGPVYGNVIHPMEIGTSNP